MPDLDRDVERRGRKFPAADVSAPFYKRACATAQALFGSSVGKSRLRPARKPGARLEVLGMAGGECGAFATLTAERL